jgi:hypothetical protein
MTSLDGFSADAGITVNVGDITLVLDTKCPVCAGSGQMASYDPITMAARGVPCGHCHGLKTVPSPEGARLLAFVKKYLSLEANRVPQQQPAATGHG